MQFTPALHISFVALTLVMPLASAGPITVAGDPIVAGQLVFSDFTIAAVGEIPTQNSIPSASNGQAGAAIDGNMATAYTNFGAANSGYIVTPAVGLSNVTGLTLTTATDSPSSDPLTFSLYGTNVPLTNITAGTVFTLDDFTAITTDQTTGLLPQIARGATVGIALTNTENFKSYLLVFPTVRNADAASLKIAEAILTGSSLAVPRAPLAIKSYNFNFTTNQLTLTWTSVPTESYRITSSDNLLPPWNNITINVSGAAMQSETSTTVNFVRGTRGFFRVELE